MAPSNEYGAVVAPKLLVAAFVAAVSLFLLPLTLSEGRTLLIEPDDDDLLLRNCIEQSFEVNQASWPSDGADYQDASSLAFNFRTAKPTVVLWAKTSLDVANGISCAYQHGYGVSAAGGRHSFQGASVPDGYVVVDTSGLDSISMNDTDLTVTVGSGCTNAMMLAAVHNSSVKGALTLTGSCPSVGVAGYVLGGGMGDITPYVGLKADSVESAKMVLWNGTQVTASRKENADLFWAMRGGGGGTGIITEMTMKSVTAPDPDHFTYFELKYKPSHSVNVSLLLQQFLDSNHTSSTVNETNEQERRRMGGSGTLKQSGWELRLVFLGTWQEGLAVLEQGGLLDSDLLLAGQPELSVNFTSHPQAEEQHLQYRSFATQSEQQVPLGVHLEVHEFPTYGHVESYIYCKRYEWSLGLAELNDFCRSSSLESCDTTPSCDNEWTLNMFLSMAADRKSPLNLGVGEWSTHQEMVSVGGLLARELSEDTWRHVVDVASSSDRPKNCNADFQLNHFAGGAVEEIGPNQSAFPWRSATMLFSYGLIDASTTEEERSECVDFSRRYTNYFFNDAGSQEILGGYYNYLGNEKPLSFYFGSNLERLQEIKGEYDPTNVFGKALTVEEPPVELFRSNNE